MVKSAKRGEFQSIQFMLSHDIVISIEVDLLLSVRDAYTTCVRLTTWEIKAISSLDFEEDMLTQLGFDICL